MAPKLWKEVPEKSVGFLSSRQFWLAAYDVGVTKESLFDSIRAEYPVEEAGRIILEIEVTTNFSRDYPLVGELCKVMGLTEEELDALWVWASKI